MPQSSDHGVVPMPDPERALIERLRLHAYDLVNGGANASQLRDDLNTAAALLASRSPGSGWQEMADAAEMLWVVLANASGGDWNQQTSEWQEAAARWRDNYFAALRLLPDPPSVAPRQEQEQEKKQVATRGDVKC